MLANSDLLSSRSLQNQLEDSQRGVMDVLALRAVSVGLIHKDSVLSS